MKKYIVGFLAGAVFAISATAFADTIPSLIGKKVQAQYTVEVNGKVLNTVVVEGSNYAPVRSLGEAAGYDVSLEGKKVILNMPTTSALNQLSEDEKKERISSLQEAIKSKQERIATVTQILGEKRESSLTATTDKDKAAYKDVISQLEWNLTEYQSALESLQAQLTELQQQP
ncbi:hypothetical protein [Paenibacillus sp. FSL R10-2771]|uniref:hypothetical protein n=1 Tax=Paenibacillus sp. FSL R10-2771 TaxID=2954693 RepID=UPI0030F860C7